MGDKMYDMVFSGEVTAVIFDKANPSINEYKIKNIRISDTSMKLSCGEDKSRCYLFESVKGKDDNRDMTIQVFRSYVYRVIMSDNNDNEIQIDFVFENTGDKRAFADCFEARIDDDIRKKNYRPSLIIDEGISIYSLVASTR